MSVRPAFRLLLFAVAGFLSVLPTPLGAEPLDPAVVGERLQRLNAAVEAVEQTSISQKRQIDALGNELQRLRDETSKELGNRAGQRPWAEDLRKQSEEIKRHADDLKRLAEAINEVDRKRAADNEAVLKILGDLKKSVTAAAEAPPVRSPGPVRSTHDSRPPSSPSTGSDPAEADRSGAAVKAVPYTVGRGETLGAIVDSFNLDAKKKGYQTLTVQQVMRFNKLTNANRINEGTKINLPLYPKSEQP